MDGSDQLLVADGQLAAIECVRPGCGLVFKVDLSAVRAPPTGIVASSLGPI
jgi:hypothetical protein